MPAGEWFERLALLPDALEQYRSKSNFGLKRAMIMVPSRGLVANAIAWGYSKYALRNPVEPLVDRPISDLVNVTPGIKVQLKFPDYRGQNEKQIRVGVFKSLAQGMNKPIIQMVQNGVLKTYGLKEDVTFSIVPDFTPDGDYPEPLASQKSDRAQVLNSFNTQHNPMAIIFTELGSYQEELSFEFLETSIRETLGVETLSLEQATRVDRYSDDQHPHFVNTWDYFRHYDEIRDGLGENIQAYRAVVLDGNLSLEALAQRDEFRDRFVLGIFETSRSVLQERGASAFLGDAAYYLPIPDFESQLEWQAPDGIRIWGWS